MKKLKKGQAVMYREKKYEFIEYSPTSPIGAEQRVILKRAGDEPIYEVLERELEIK